MASSSSSSYGGGGGGGGISGGNPLELRLPNVPDKLHTDAAFLLVCLQLFKAHEELDQLREANARLSIHGGGGHVLEANFPQHTEQNLATINPRQYDRIVKRRATRKTLVGASGKRKKHKSRQLHAKKRPRGAGGRFLNQSQQDFESLETQFNNEQ